MKSKGFTLVETIVITLFLAISLLLVYRSFTTTLEQSKIRRQFDNTMYIYRTYFMIDYLKNNGLASYLNDESLNDYVCGTGYYENGYCYTTDPSVLTSTVTCPSGWSVSGSQCIKSASSTSCSVNTSTESVCTKYYKTCSCTCKYKGAMPGATCNYTDSVYGTQYANTNTCSSACNQHAETMDGDWFYCSVVSGSCYENGTCVPGYTENQTVYSCDYSCDYSTGSGSSLSCYQYTCASGSLSGSTCYDSSNTQYTCASGWELASNKCRKLSNLNQANGYKILTCNLFTNSDHCDWLVEKYNIDKMYLINYDKSNLNYDALLPSLVDYVKTITTEGEGYRLIVKFKNGEYASLKVNI